MAKVRALAHRMAIPSADTARTMIVAGCALALILAGKALPF